MKRLKPGTHLRKEVRNNFINIYSNFDNLIKIRNSLWSGESCINLEETADEPTMR